jgi:hypothetical protein
MTQVCGWRLPGRPWVIWTTTVVGEMTQGGDLAHPIGGKTGKFRFAQLSAPTVFLKEDVSSWKLPH